METWTTEHTTQTMHGGAVLPTMQVVVLEESGSIGAIVARLHPVGPTPVDFAMVESRAREIAAAPAMREALATTLGNLRSLKDNTFRQLDTIDEWIAVVEAALSQAQG